MKNELLAAPQINTKTLNLRCKNDENLIFRSYKKLKELASSLKNNRTNSGMKSSLNLSHLKFSNQNSKSMGKIRKNNTVNHTNSSSKKCRLGQADIDNSYKLINNAFNEEFLENLNKEINKNKEVYSNNEKDEYSTKSISPVSNNVKIKGKKDMEAESLSNTKRRINFDLEIYQNDDERSNGFSILLKKCF